MSTCIAVIDGCEECTDRRDHEGGCWGTCRLIAKLISTPEGHEAWHRARYCPACRTPKELGIVRLCRYGNCTETHCPVCDGWLGAIGPVDCPCNSTWWTRLWLRIWSWRDRRTA